MLHNAWKLKNQINAHVSNTLIDECYDKARQIGALGGKLLGAAEWLFTDTCVTALSS